jgi:nitroreductase
MTTHDLTRDALRSAVASAVRAPSMHNTQPWIFRLLDDGVEVYADRTRQLPAADPTGRALRVSCGAAIFNLRLAFAHLGYVADVRLLPAGRPPDLLARLTAGRAGPATPEEHGLHAAIPRRRSNRLPFLDTAVPLDVRARLARAAAAQDGWLDLILGPTALDMVAELVRTADRALVSDGAYRTELTAWTRPDDTCTDGVPHGAGGPAPEPHDLVVGRDFGGPPRAPGRGFETEPLIGVLGSHADTPRDDLVAGQALQRVLLTAAWSGLSASLFSQPIDVAPAREQLRLGLRRHGAPHMLMRFGYGVPAPATPRRPVASVLLPEAAHHRVA